MNKRLSMNNKISLSQYMTTKILTFILALSILTPLQSAEPFVAQQNGIYISPGKISLIAQQLFWLSAISPFIASAIHCIKVLTNEQQTLKNDNCVEVNEQVAHFIRTEIRKITDKPIDSVVVHPALSDICPVVSLSKSILIAQCVADEITTALETNNLDTLNMWSAVMHHEAQHIQHNDVMWRAVTELTVPIAVGGIILSLKQKSSQMLKLPFWDSQIFTVYCGSVSYLISLTMQAILCKYQEQRADNGILNEMQFLKGMKTFLKNWENLNKERYTYWPSTYNVIRSIQNIFEAHPLPKKRITQLNKRIAKLKQKQQNQELHA